LQDFITDIEQNLRRTEQAQSVILAREKYEVDKVLEIDDKVNCLDIFLPVLTDLEIDRGHFLLS
jgi:hypothetical protein